MVTMCVVISVNSASRFSREETDDVIVAEGAGPYGILCVPEAREMKNSATPGPPTH
jgi:hypothetical protein